MNILRWFCRWVVWLFLIIREMSDDMSSEREIFKRAIPVAFGSTALLMMLFFLGVPGISNEWRIMPLPWLVALSFLVYLLIGLALFLLGDRVTNASDVPWYDNGPW